jgi:hypothetical protein
MIIYFILTISGILLPNILSKTNIFTGQKGIDYYNEAHKSKLNKFIHMICMPITIYGMTIFIPLLLNYIFNSDIFYTELGLFLFYFNHYVNINKKVALWMIIMYGPVVMMGYIYCKNIHNDLENIIYGLKISGSSLLVQEIFGHYLGGDIPSRIEGVFNAILYAIYCSVFYSLSEFEYSIEYFRDKYMNRFWKDDDDELKVLSITVNRKNLSIIILINKLNELDLDVIYFKNVYSYHTLNTLKNFYLSKGFNNNMQSNNNSNKKKIFSGILIILGILLLLCIYNFNEFVLYVLVYYIIISYNWIIEIYPIYHLMGYNPSGILIVSRYPILEVNNNHIIVKVNDTQNVINI